MSVRNFLINALIFFAGMVSAVALVFLSTMFMVAHVLLTLLVKYGIFALLFCVVLCLLIKVFRKPKSPKTP